MKKLGVIILALSLCFPEMAQGRQCNYPKPPGQQVAAKASDPKEKASPGDQSPSPVSKKVKKKKKCKRKKRRPGASRAATTPSAAFCAALS